MSTYEAWTRLLDMANESIDVGSFYWTLRREDVFNHSSAWQGEKIFEKFLFIGAQRKVKIRIAQSAPSSVSPNIDTEILMKRRAAEVRSLNFERLLGGGVLHTKFWIVDQQHMYERNLLFSGLKLLIQINCLAFEGILGAQTWIGVL